MAFVNCNLCGADDYKVLYPQGTAQLHQIVRCNRCSLMYANPQVSVDAVTYTAPDLHLDLESRPIRQYIQKQNVQLTDNLRVLQVLNELFPQRGTLLEVGSFLGTFLNRIRSDGWNVTGLEPLADCAKYAQEQYGLNVIRDILENAPLPACSFDAVVMLHVVEHLPDPAETVRKIRSIIKPGGVLVIETPRFDSLMFRILGRRERSISNCNGHIYFFTVPCLTKLLERNGFKVFKTRLVGRTLTADRLLYNVGVISRSQALQRAADRLGSTMHLDKLRLHVNVRDMQQLYCRAN